MPLLPKSLMYKYIRTKRIKLNGKRCEISTRLCENDIMQLYIGDEFFETSLDRVFMSVPADISVVYEDGNILLCDKKNGLVVHEDDENTADTLINRILHYLYNKGEYDPDRENSFTPALCNRLDRNTGGIVIAAKNAESLRILNEKIKERELEKRYLCITVGVPPKKSDTMTAYLEKDEKTKTVKVTDRKTPQNKTIITSYKVLKTDGKLALVEVRLDTGRISPDKGAFRTHRLSAPRRRQVRHRRSEPRVQDKNAGALFLQAEIHVPHGCRNFKLS